MELGPRIADRLRVLGISQAELARRAGVAQSTINSLVKKPRRSSPHLLRIARELETTPAYLTGETDDPQSNLPDQHLTSEEIGWVQRLARLDDDTREAVLQLIDTLGAKGPVARGLHDGNFDYRQG